MSTKTLHQRTRVVSMVLAVGSAMGCGTPPPASQLPNARAALDRLHATQDCGGGLQASAKIDHFGKQGRVRGDLLMFAVWPASLRMDVVSPFGVTLATLTSDGARFSLSDLREKRFFAGPASACNIARLTTVPMPGHVLVSLLRGESPVLLHDAKAATVEWSSGGYYVLRIQGGRGAEETIHVAPHPADRQLPWEKQRMRLLDVEVKQQGIVLYHAELEGHRPASMAKERIDPDGIDPPILPSGPVCKAELPESIHVEVPGQNADVLFRYETVSWNPPLVEGLFAQPVPGGMAVERVVCDR